VGHRSGGWPSLEHAPRLGLVARASAWAAVSLTQHRRVAAESLIASTAAETAHPGPSPSRVEHALQILSEASSALSAPIDLAGSIVHVARVVVPRLADWCVIDLVEGLTDVGDTGVQRAAAVHFDPRRQEVLDELTRRFPPRRDQPTLARTVIATGKSALVNDVPDEAIDRLTNDPEQAALVRRIGLCSYMIVPLRARDRLLGVIALACGQRRFDSDDFSLAEELGRRNESGLALPLHSSIIAPYIDRYGTPQQKARLLPRAVSGEAILAIAMTEPGAGSDLAGTRTRATPERDGAWRLSGSKGW